MADDSNRRNVDNGADPTKERNSEFDRFEALAGKLVQVSKKELDEKRKAEARRGRSASRR